jgi:hypothetical protein
MIKQKGYPLRKGFNDALGYYTPRNTVYINEQKSESPCRDETRSPDPKVNRTIAQSQDYMLWNMD